MKNEPGKANWRFGRQKRVPGNRKCAKMLRTLRTLQKTREICMNFKKIGLRMLRTLQSKSEGEPYARIACVTLAR
jgi:hypothetical protein